jgi:RNA polymerase-binding transcription factor DksA
MLARHFNMNTRLESNNHTSAPAEHEIRERAYQLYEQSGRLPGRDWDNWLRAEAELRSPPASAKEAVPRKWRWHYRTLTRIREALLRERDEHTAVIRAPLFRGGVDAGDVASNVSERETLVAKLAMENGEIAEVEAALARIRAGTYGFCEATGAVIAAARLRAVPWARTNVAHSHSTARALPCALGGDR